MPVQTVLQALVDKKPDYERIRDCIAGQRRVKEQTTKYLPVPDPDEPNVDALNKRYTAYSARAVFYGVTGRTLRGLVGLVSDKDPAVETPDLLTPLLADIDGAGTPCDQQATKTLRDVVSLGRAGLFVDYPTTDGVVSRLQQISGNVRPVTIRYMPEQVINWRWRAVGAKIRLSLVVIEFQDVVEDDGFAETYATRYRILRLEKDNTYSMQVIDADGTAGPVLFPTDGKGLKWDEIPFTFVGSEDNTPSIDESPLLDIANLNIAHFCNSADYEESVFILGQPTPVFSGLTKDWVQNVLKNEVRLGSRAAVPLPAGGSAELLQAEPNTLAAEAMKHKEEQMIAIGAKLIENVGTVQTATEATLDSVLDNSVLGTCARNVSAAYRQCLGWMWRYMTGEIVDDPEVIDYALNTDFAGRMLTAQERSEIVSEWVKGAITWEEMRWNLKRSGIAYEDDDTAKETIAAAREDTAAFEAEATAMLAKAAGNDKPPTKDD